MAQQNNNNEGWQILLYGLIGGALSFASYQYYQNIYHLQKVRRDILGEPQNSITSYLQRFLGTKNDQPKLSPCPKSVSQVNSEIQKDVSNFDKDRYYLVSGVLLKDMNNENQLQDLQSLQKYLLFSEGRQTIAKILYKNKLSDGSLSSSAGFKHIDSIYDNSKFYMLDANLIQKLTSSNFQIDQNLQLNQNILKVNLNQYFGAWQLPQKRQLVSEASLSQYKVIQYENIQMKVKEGACLSVLGTLSFDLQSGQLQMDNLVAILAGGLYEAKKYLKVQIKHQLQWGRILAALGSIFFSLTFYKMYILYLQSKYQNELKELKNGGFKRMPTVKAEEMRMHCLICMTHPSNIVLVPCNHLCICEQCHAQLIEKEKDHSKCPMCRKQFDLFKKIIIVHESNN